MNAVVTNLTLSSFYDNGFHYSPTNFSYTNNSKKSNLDNMLVRFILQDDSSRQLGNMQKLTGVKKNVLFDKALTVTREVRKKKDKHKEHHFHHHHEGGHHEKACHHKHSKGGGDKGHKKFMMPMMLGLLTAKAIILPLVLKAMALLSAKGIILGLIATVMASILSLKKMVEPSHPKYDKRDDVTKIEVLPIPIQEHHRPKNYPDITEEDDYHPYHGHY